MAAALKKLADSFLEDKLSWEPSTFLGSVRELVDREETAAVLEILQNDHYKELVESVAWDLFPIITPHVTDTETNNEVYNNSAQMLNTLAEIGKPKEMILGYLEQLDRFLDDGSYRTLLRPLSTVLMRFGLTKSYHLNQSFLLLYAHLQTIKFPSTQGLDEKQRRLLLEDPDVLRLGRSTIAVLEFLAPFIFQVEEMLYGNARELSELERTEVENSKIEIAKLLIKILDYPLARTDLAWKATEEDSDVPRHKSDFRLCAEQVMTYLSRLQFSFNQLLCYGRDFNLPVAPSTEADDLLEDDQGPGDITGLPALGLGCFVYLVQVEEMEDDRLPAVYSCDHLLQLTNMYIAALLRKAEEEPVFKGLSLLSLLVEGIEDGGLHHRILDNTFYEDLPQMLSVVMVMSPLNIVRQEALKVFPVYIRKFDWKGRYRLLQLLLKNTVHSGVCGMVIGMVKDYVHHTLQHHDNDWFVGHRLGDLFSLIFSLPNGAESDMLELSDKVMAALNCLRFLLLRDSASVNETGIWSHIPHIERGFIDPLHTGINLSIAHYQTRMTALMDEHKARGKNKSGPVPSGSLTVAGHQLPVMPPSQQMHVMKSACFTYELMQSIVGRVRDILSANERSSDPPRSEVKDESMS
ncbi:glomulin-like [Lytechinus variegatus]|uniref:glomulin-like n=1 Tax=Lytechinus variegatus TaxID=7654 RepID=UPI001BB17729|nr:glomulin-like [Lytechinus variegatus]